MVLEYLENYLSSLEERPEVAEDPSKYKGSKVFNIVYRVSDGIFVHAMSRRSEDGYFQYIVIEPSRPPQKILEDVEVQFAKAINYKQRVPETTQEKEERMRTILSKLKVKGFNREYLIYHFIRDKLYSGPIEPLIRDPFVEDISLPGLGYVYIVHKLFGPMKTSIKIETQEELDELIVTLSEKTLRPVSHNRPILDASLPDGSRVNFVFGTDISRRGSNLTIRKFSKVPMSITQLVAGGTISPMLAGYLWMMLDEGMNVFVCGETASGVFQGLPSVSSLPQGV